jgi:hypothetical protein
METRLESVMTRAQISEQIRCLRQRGEDLLNYQAHLDSQLCACADSRSWARIKETRWGASLALARVRAELMAVEHGVRAS